MDLIKTIINEPVVHLSCDKASLILIVPVCVCVCLHSPELLRLSSNSVMVHPDVVILHVSLRVSRLSNARY